MTVKQYALNIQCKLSTRNIKYTLMQLQQGLLFKVVMAAGIRFSQSKLFCSSVLDTCAQRAVK